jgi:hypothetical protein
VGLTNSSAIIGMSLRAINRVPIIQQDRRPFGGIIAINPMTTQKLQPYLDDYYRVTGTKTDKFICPLTLEPCESDQLIDGHILNSAFAKASRKTIVQFGKPDHFYGSRVEPGMIKFLNLGYEDISLIEAVKGQSTVDVRISDGSTFKAFPLKNRDMLPKVEHRFPILSAPQDDGRELLLAIKTERNNPKFASPIRLEFEIIAFHEFTRAHWVAGMLKAGFLTLFQMLGYAAVFDPFGDSLRRHLADYYYNDASSDEASKYFCGYQNATKIVGQGSTIQDFENNYQQIDFDTLDDSKMLLHYTRSKTIFAATCIFQINDMSVSVTLPQSTRKSDVEAAVKFYQRLMEGEPNLPQVIRLSRFCNDHMEINEQPLECRYL